jgi:hypothetical protein
MRFVAAAALALVGWLAGINCASAQDAAMKTTPTTKILAIGTINPGFEQSQVRAVLPEEVRETVDLYLAGKIEQWYSLQGKPGVAFIINVTDPAVAHEMLEKLPLGKAHMMSFEPDRPAQPASVLAGHAAETLRRAMPDLGVARSPSARRPFPAPAADASGTHPDSRSSGNGRGRS